MKISANKYTAFTAGFIFTATDTLIEVGIIKGAISIDNSDFAPIMSILFLFSAVFLVVGVEWFGPFFRQLTNSATSQEYFDWKSMFYVWGRMVVSFIGAVVAYQLILTFWPGGTET